MPDPSLPAAWAALHALAARPGGRAITPLFAADPRRAARHSFVLGDLTLDLSKTAIDDAVEAALFALANAAGVEDFRARLFAGAPVNASERRAAMHMALRAPDDAGLRAALPDGIDDASGLVATERTRMRDFVTAVHEGRLLGATGQRFDTVLNIGIGGSDLGPRMAVEALTTAAPGRMAARFLSNVDGHALVAALGGLDPARTLVLIASKSFTTLETATNADAVRGWIADALGAEAVGRHCVALSTNLKRVAEFGIKPEFTFGFRDWVGGRYSLWSPVGLSIPLAAGWEAFQAMLDGAWAMDCHFRDTALADNLPVRMALAGVWHVNALGTANRAVLAYDDRLRHLPAFLQQLEMESNGKSVHLDGSPVAGATCPVIFGEPGTNAQHSFMQLLHQGPATIPVDFILAAVPDHDRVEAHRILAANAFAQAEALLHGRSLADLRAEMAAGGMAEAEIDRLAPHRVCPGERPSATILFERLSPYALGRLIALYEHKVAVQGCLWGIDSFDQWGVELGKVLAGNILPDLADDASGAASRHDGSTAALIARFRALRGEG